MKKILLLPFLLLACSSQKTAPAHYALNGLWQQISIACDNDPNDSFFAKERQAIAEGKARNTLEIRDGKVETRYWRHRFGDPAEKGHCTMVINQEWEIADKAYRVLKISEPRYEDVEGEVCPTKTTKNVPTLQMRPYELNVDQLKIFSPGSPKELPKDAPKKTLLVCPGANLVVTYRRVK